MKSAPQLMKRALQRVGLQLLVNDVMLGSLFSVKNKWLCGYKSPVSGTGAKIEIRLIRLKL